MGRKPKKDLKMSSVDEQDERFKHVAYDARFQRFPSRNKNKVKVDDRFQRMFTDEEFRVGASKDKRGRKGKDKQDEARRYYRLDDADDDGGDGDKLLAASSDGELDERTMRALRMRGLAGSSSSESEEDEESDSDSEKSDLEVDNELADGVLDENLAELYDEWGVGAYAANPNEDVPMMEDSTKRLACLDMDWGNVKAVDIFAVLRSFVPDGGRIVSVTVYPSEYGLEKMEEEKAAGPRQIYTKRAGGEGRAGGVEGGLDEDEDASDESDDSSGDDDGGMKDDGGALDEARLRYYERSKLRWHYAIVVCSNVKTAEAIYTECDGMEYMKTANMFDLRFVPDDQSFEGRQVRDSATDVPDDYVAPVFQTKALQHTNVELTWDKVDGERKKTLSRKLNADDLKDEDFMTYLASASEDEELDQDDLVPDGDPDAVRKRYQDLLQKSDAGAVTERRGRKGWGAEEDSDGEGHGPGDGGNDANGLASLGCVADKNMELQVTFEQDLEVLGEKLSTKAKERKSGKGAETVWDAYVRRKKEKKEEARRKGRVNYHSSDDDYEDDFDSDIEEEEEPISPPKNGKGGEADDPFDDPFFSSNDAFKDPSDPSLRKKKKSKRGADGGSHEDDEERRRRKAELEMLIMDDALTGKRGKTKSSDHDELENGAAAQKKPSKRERMKLAKMKKRAEREDGSDNEDLEAVNREYLDMKDPRFQDVFENPEFALDPTDPRFAKAGTGASKLASEAARRRSRAKTSSKARTAPKADSGAGNETKGLELRGKADLKLMVASLKRKQAGAPASQREGKNW